VIGTKRRADASCRRARVQSGGMKSHAVRGEGGGMPGVSGELKLCAPPTCGAFAKLPGVVP
jgi:hypothetical protein